MTQSTPAPSSLIRETLELAHPDTELVFLDPPGLDVAIVGTAERLGMDPVVVYDRTRLLAALVADGMTEDGAMEWLDFNIEGAYVGASTPLVLTSLESLSC